VAFADDNALGKVLPKNLWRNCHKFCFWWVNGIRTETKTFDAANQVVGWTYDAAGNLLYDGSLSYGYDALNRLVQQGTTVNRYNGDGALVQTDRVAYTQDLASSLSKVLQINDGTDRTNYIYGHERLLSDAAGGEWYATDALGSLRFTLDGDGLATSGTTYDPFGQRERGTIATFGFTGELQDANSDNVYLRARWYNPSHGAFMAQDPFSGFDTLPYSMHPYQYAYSNPTLYTDPSGRCIDPVSRTMCWGVGSAIAEAVGAGLTAIGSASAFVAGAAGAATAGVGFGVYYFGFAENAEENRAALARGWDYATSGGENYVWLDEAPQTTTAPPLTPAPGPAQQPQGKVATPGPATGGVAVPTPNDAPVTVPVTLPIDCVNINTSNERKQPPHKVLIVGEGRLSEWSYPVSLSLLHPNWDITSTSYAPGNSKLPQMLLGKVANIKVIVNVDATRLSRGFTGIEKYNGIIFNNPHVEVKPVGSNTANIIAGFIVSARARLKPSGEIHINVTRKLVNDYQAIRNVLGVQTGLFGQSKYYAPFLPRYTAGGFFNYYFRSPYESAKLLNYIFR
jgi:RHS repeat-associated protein